jgi:hypothetical protein
VRNALKNILTDNPSLTRLHVQDGVGGESRRHPDGTIGYPRTADHDVIPYYNNILVPAANATSAENNIRINMEFFVSEASVSGEEPRGMYVGIPSEQEIRQSKYAQANVPLGACFELRWWYGSMWYRTVPDVTRRDISIALQLSDNAGVVAIVTGPSTNSKVVSQNPQGGTYRYGAMASI